MKWINASKPRISACAALIGATAILAAALSVPTGTFAQQKIKFSFAHLGPTTGPVIQAAFVPIMKELEATGKVEVTYYGAG